MIKEVYSKVKEKRNIEVKLQQLSIQQNELDSKVSKLSHQLQKEQNDVMDLEMGGLAHFFHSVLGNLEDKLEKEKQEVIEVKTKLNSCNLQLDSIKKEISCYEQKLIELENIDVEYESLYQKKYALVKSNVQVLQKEEEIVNSNQYLKEINEVIEAIEIANKKAVRLKDALDSALNWATYDMVSSNGLFSHMMKYDKIDKAEQYINEFQIQLNKVKVELCDIQLEKELSLTIGEFERFADWFFDNIFLDYSIRSKIKDTIDQLNNVMRQLDRLYAHLKQMQSFEQDNINKLQEALETTIVNM